MTSYLQTKWLMVDEDVEVGIKQLNEYLYNMQMTDKYQLHDVKPFGNSYFIIYQKTILSEEVMQDEKANSEGVSSMSAGL